MTVVLTADQQAWLEARVARGEFASVGAAARQLLDERIAERMIEDGDDLAWAEPYVAAALADVARGDVVSRQDHEARIDALLDTLKG